MKKTNIIFGISILALLTLAACKRTLPSPGQTMAQNAAGNWWVTLKHGSTPIAPYFFLATYNTAANTTDSIWVDDDLQSLNAFFQTNAQDSLLYYTWGIPNSSFKVKAGLQYTGLGFSGSDLENQYWSGDTTSSEMVSIFNGRIFPKGTTSRTGVRTDSIYFQAVFSKNPVDTFVISGYERTGQIDDDN